MPPAIFLHHAIRDQLPFDPSDVSPDEWQARVDLAACYRLVDYYGMTDLIYNHITARVPDRSITS